MSTDMNPDEGPTYSSTVDLPISSDEALSDLSRQMAEPRSSSRTKPLHVAG
jgi:hypothetical protein